SFCWPSGAVLSGEENISSPVLREVKFHSVDYRNILHWKTQSHPDGNQKYFVQYKIYGEKHWTTARHCQGITQLYCDLSQQTSDPWERYYARVQAEVSGHQSSWVLSPRFNPHWETSVSPPTMRLNVTERAIVVRLKPPKSPYRRRRGSWISMKKLQKDSELAEQAECQVMYSQENKTSVRGSGPSLTNVPVDEESCCSSTPGDQIN
uniref:Interleukin 22 receptor subunit alpha 2 n=1 Tax=Paramormyrops kingsleyae TaxID=1676925 RepID=A0A3B3QZA7_9TELE